MRIITYVQTDKSIYLRADNSLSGKDYLCYHQLTQGYFDYIIATSGLALNLIEFLLFVVIIAELFRHAAPRDSISGSIRTCSTGGGAVAGNSARGGNTNMKHP